MELKQKSKTVLIRIDRTLAEDLRQLPGKNYSEKIELAQKKVNMDLTINWKNIRKVAKEIIRQQMLAEPVLFYKGKYIDGSRERAKERRDKFLKTGVMEDRKESVKDLIK